MTMECKLHPEVTVFLEQAIDDLTAGRFMSADMKIQRLLENVDGAGACFALQTKIFLRLAQGRPAEARNITSFMAYCYSEATLSNGWSFLLRRVSDWPFLTLLIDEYRRALADHPPADPAWQRVTRTVLEAA